MFSKVKKKRYENLINTSNDLLVLLVKILHSSLNSCQLLDHSSDLLIKVG